MQAIETQFIGPTNHRGARVSARCQAKRIVISWDNALSVNENHDAAAFALASKLGWVPPHYGRLVGGGAPDGKGNVYVMVSLADCRDVLENCPEKVYVMQGTSSGKTAYVF